jgi:hypothetical protein
MSEIRRLRQLEEENGRLKKIVAQQALDLDALNFPSRLTGKVPLSDSTLPVTAFGRSRPAADASREVGERW